MPYFKAPNDSLHWLDDLEFFSLLPKGSVKITDEEASAITAESVPSTLPTTVVSPVQALTVLDNHGLLSTLDSYMADPTTPLLVRRAYLMATSWERNSLLVMNAAITLGLSPLQVDALFEEAGKVVV